MENTEVIILPELSMFFSMMHSQAGDGRSALLPCLHAAQDLYGYLPEGVITEISNNISIPVAEIQEVIDFYPLFHREPIRKTILHVCNDHTCKLAGVETTFRTIYHPMDEDFVEGETTAEKAPCLGLCAHAPSIFIEKNLMRIPVKNGSSYQTGQSTFHTRTEILGKKRIITTRCGHGRSIGLVEYWSNDGYQALKRALTMSSSQIIEEIKVTGLTGRGGDAFLTGVKWEKVATSNHKTRFIVCNGAESDPTIYKDRVLLEDDPHSVLEGMILAAYAVQASQGYIYINGDYTLALDSISRAILDARESGLLGRNIMGTGFNFDIELRKGAGRYISGEETAMLNSIEGKCAIPRKKPSFPTSHGLFDMPTVVNNVETFCNVPAVIRMQPSSFREFGTDTSKGTILICLTGDIAKQGIAELPFGITFRQLIYELGGGIVNGHTFQAAIVGGVTGKFISEDDLDTCISLECLQKANLSLGPGSVIVLDNTRNIKNVLARVGNFLARESCGLCSSCVIGTQTQMELLNQFKKSKLSPDDIRRFRETLYSMEKNSQCKLGKNAANLARSAFQKWPSRFINLDS